MKPVIEFVLSVPEEHAQITPVSSLIEELPCGCRAQQVTPATPRSTQSDGRSIPSYFSGSEEKIYCSIQLLGRPIFILQTSLVRLNY